MAKSTISDWHQIDAGVWRQIVSWGHWEICFFSDRNGRQMFEVSAYDARKSEMSLDDTTPVFGSLETARSYAEARTMTDIVHRGA